VSERGFDEPAPRFGRRHRRASSAGSEWRRTRRLVGLGAVLVVTAVTLGSALRGEDAAIDIGGAAPEAAPQLVVSPPPRPLKLAARGPVLLYMPVNASRVTAIVYHRVGDADTLELTPSGNLLNAGIVDRIERRVIGATEAAPDYFIADGSTAAVDVGAAPGTQVYSPVNGTILAIAPNIINGTAWGAQIAIQPQADPGSVVMLGHLTPDPSLRVGQVVAASQEPTLLGTVTDLSEVLEMELARYTSDDGNHVHVEVRPAAVLAIP
jgi:hypothetical protein